MNLVRDHDPMFFAVIYKNKIFFAFESVREVKEIDLNILAFTF